MLFFTCILCIICLGLIFPKSKFILALGFFLLFVVSTHFQAGNDISNIKNTFTFPETTLNEETGDRSLIFYFGLVYLNSIGFSFFQVRCLDFAIWGIAVCILITKFSKYPSYTLSCCFLFPILTFASQMRNGIAAAFFYFAIISLFSFNHKYRGIVAYVIFVIIAGLFHYLGFVFLIGLVALLPISDKKLKKYVLITSILVFILYNGGVLYLCISLFSSYYAQTYFSGHGQPQVYLFILLTTGIIINYKFSEFAFFKIQQNTNKYSEGTIKFSEFITRLNVLSFIFIPLLWTNGSMYRIYQILFILTCITVANASNTLIYRKSNRNRGSDFRFAYFCFFMCVSFFYYSWQGEFVLFFNSIKL